MKKNLRLSLLFTIFISILSICFSRFSYAANESYSTWNGLTTSVINDSSVKHIIFNRIDLTESITHDSTNSITSGDATINVVDDTIYVEFNNILQLNADSSNLFKDYKYIETINGLKYIDTSLVTNMSSMFEGCNNLLDFDFSNFVTTNVTNLSNMFKDCTNIENINVGNFVTTNVTDMNSMFKNCTNLISISMIGFNTTNVTNISNMFENCSNIELIDISSFNTINITNMSSLFNGCTKLKTILVGSNWDTNSVINSTDMFKDCTLLKEYNSNKVDIENANLEGYLSFGAHWNGFTGTNFKSKSNVTKVIFNSTTKTGEIHDNSTSVISGDTTISIVDNIAYVDFEGTLLFNRNSEKLFQSYKYIETIEGFENVNTLNVTAFNYTFSGMTALKSVDISSFNTINATTFQSMFSGTVGVEDVIIGDWDTRNITTMQSMFYNCHAVKSLDMSSFVTPKLTTLRTIFYDCNALEFLDVSNLITTNVHANEDMGWIFFGCSKLKELDVSRWDTRNATFMKSMFCNCSLLKELDVSNFNTSNVTDMSYMFDHCLSLETLDVSNFDTSNVTNMSYLFYECESLKNIDVSKWNTSNTINIIAMFDNCFLLETIDVSNFDTRKVEDMSSLFYGCKLLEKIDISNFDTSSLLYFGYVFGQCTNLKEIVYGDKFDTSKVEDFSGLFTETNFETIDLSMYDTSSGIYMYNMFMDCVNLKEIDLSGFVTTTFTDISGMFARCINLEEVDLGTFDTRNLTDIGYYYQNPNTGEEFFSGMFTGCTKLKRVYVNPDTWDMSNIADSRYLFEGCTNLIGENGTKYNPENNDLEYARVDGENPGYLSMKFHELKNEYTKLSAKNTTLEHILSLTTLTDYTYDILDINHDKVTKTNLVTGDIVRVKKGNDAEIFKIIIPGDNNGDGNVNALDYVRIKNHIMDAKKLDKTAYKEASDLDGNSKIEALDYVKVKNMIMNGEM